MHKLLTVLLLLPSVCVSQDTSGSTSSVLGAALISRLYRVSGWDNPGLGSATAAAQIKVGGATESEPMTFSGSVSGAIRYDVTGPEGTVTTVVTSASSAQGTNGRFVAVPRRRAEALRSPVFPFFFLASMDGSSARYVRQEVVGGQVADVVEMSSSNRVKILTLWISHDSGYLLQMSYPVLSPTNTAAVTMHTRIFSGYKLIDGVLFPFRQNDYADDELKIEIEFTNVQFNSTSPSLFQVPAQEQ